MSPEPVIAPDFFEASFVHVVENGGEVADDVERVVIVLVDGESAEEIAPGPNGLSKVVDSAQRVREVFEDVEGADEIEGGLGQPDGAQVVDVGEQAATVHAPVGEGEHGGADVGGGGEHAVGRVKHRPRARAGAEVETTAAAVFVGELERDDVGQGRVVIDEGVPPHEGRDVLLDFDLVVEAVDGGGVLFVDSSTPGVGNLGSVADAKLVDLLGIASVIFGQFRDDAGLERVVAGEEEGLLPLVDAPRKRASRQLPRRS